MDERKDYKYLEYRTKELIGKIRSCVELRAIIQSISDFFAKNQDNIYNANEIFEVAISPFHSINLNDFAIIEIVKVVCISWVNERKLSLIKIDGEYFYHARKYVRKRKFAKKKIIKEIKSDSVFI